MELASASLSTKHADDENNYGQENCLQVLMLTYSKFIVTIFTAWILILTIECLLLNTSKF